MILLKLILKQLIGNQQPTMLIELIVKMTGASRQCHKHVMQSETRRRHILESAPIIFNLKQLRQDRHQYIFSFGSTERCEIAI